MEQGNGGISEKEDKKCETEAEEIPCGAGENRPNRAENRAAKEQNICISGRGKG